MTALLLIAVAIGTLLGWSGGLHLHIPNWMEWTAFSVMLFGIGLELGQDRLLWQRIVKGGWRILIFPLNVIVGSSVGAIVAGLFLNIGVHRSLAVGSGFGWYSLAAVLLQQMDGPQLGAMAFIANVLRELLSFVFIPWIARYSGGSMAIALGGATSMDTTLPLIRRYTNAHMALYGFVSGVVVSTLVPFLIPLWMQL